MPEPALPKTAAELAERLSLTLVGDGARVVRGVAALETAIETDATFVAESKYLEKLLATRAALVILHPKHQCDTNATLLLSDNPRLSYAQLTHILYPGESMVAGIHNSASIAADATVDETASVGPFAVIESGAKIGPGCAIGAHCVIERGATVGEGTQMLARAVLCHSVVVGKKCLIHHGAVIGSEGFGFAPDSKCRWHRVKQLGSVRLGDQVEVGANTTIDRGAIDDTVIESGVILDNQIQIGHNVLLGENTAIAGCTGLAGSTTVGKRVQIGGHSAILGHLDIADDVVLMGHSVVSRSIVERGVYSSVLPVKPVRVWRRLVGRFRRLDKR